MIGAWSPKPEMPSCTTTPSSTATSVAFEPHCPPLVEMSTPWSSLHHDGGATTEWGLIGKTQPDGSLESRGWIFTWPPTGAGWEVTPWVATTATLRDAAPT